MTTVIEKFTKTIPDWRPRVEPVDLEHATEAQLEALKITPSNTKVSDYVLTLAHDVESLKVRSPLFNAIMYDKGGLRRSERELGAVAASVVNKCVYCTAVHVTRHAQLEKSDEVIDNILNNGLDAKLSLRNAAIFNFSVKLSGCPPEIGSDDIGLLRDADMKDEEILDLILSASLFGWANRLMHVLGDPIGKVLDDGSE